MFTGIVEEKGHVERVKQGDDNYTIVINAVKVVEDMAIGDSISVNGICLTVTELMPKAFSVDVMPETVKATSIRKLQAGDYVNLERAMSPVDRFGGHMVSGHIDGIGTIVSKRPDENAIYVEIEVDQSLLRYVVHKGSIAIDGVSLTVFGVNENTILLSLIPHTAAETIIVDKSLHEIVNVEVDMLAKYVERLLETQPKEKRGI